MKIRRITDKMVLLGTITGILFWFIESAIHYFIFKEGKSFIQEVFSKNIHEIWMRSLVVFMFIIFGIYAQLIITMRERTERKFQRQNKFLKSVLESLTYPFYVINIDNYKIEIANAAARYNRPLDKSLYCYSLTHKSDKPCEGIDHICPLAEVKKTKKPAVVEHIHYDKAGNLVNVEVYGYPIFDDKGNVIQMIEYTLDITVRRQAEKDLKKSEGDLRQALGRLEKAYKELQALDGRKSDFISTASHELKTPLTSIKSASSILIKEVSKRNSGEREKELLDIILRNTDRQARTVNDLLDLSKIEAGVLRMEKENFDVASVVQSTVELFKPQMGEKNISYYFSASQEPLFAWADSEHIKRVISNLISNAIKFTAENGEISIKLEKQDSMVRLTITDTGVGISKENLNRVFDKFYRAADSKMYTKNGTGLGLSIAKGVVEAHGGEIWAESIAGIGSSFYFTLPAEKKNEECGT
ncbi:MAG: ATP-binding protein [Candidatus Omnitrophota bacterium]